MEYCVKAVEEGFKKITDRYELHGEILEDLKNIVLASLRQYSTQINGVAKAPKVPKAVGGAGAVQKRKRNGYNCYIKYRFAQAKIDGGEDYKSQQQMAEFSRSWAELPEDEKNRFRKMADEYNKENGGDVRKKGRGGKRRVTGYNIFYRDNVDRIIQSIKDNNEDITTMKAVGREWHNLGAEGKELWKRKAQEEEKDNETSNEEE